VRPVVDSNDKAADLKTGLDGVAWRWLEGQMQDLQVWLSEASSLRTACSSTVQAAYQEGGDSREH
jgi:hypothetical protein